MQSLSSIERLCAATDAALAVVAPHPDDETLAAGGLLLRATAAGARTVVLLLTDGDNNPWPQRWMERRLRIGPAARARWARRRRAEASAALDQLGVSPEQLVAFGWEDLGISARLLGDTAASVRLLRERLLALRPTVVAAPTLADRHPDHSAARVLVELALAGWPAGVQRPTLLGFTVHGRDPQGTVALPLDATAHARKRAALEAHVSQLALSRTRLLRLAGAVEHYRLEPAFSPALSTASAIELPWRPAALLARSLELHVVFGERGWRLPWIERARGEVPGLLREGDGWQLQLPVTRPQPLYVKLVSRLPTPWIFDRWGWASESDGSALTAAADSARLALRTHT
ncbi:MAG: PIG-L family deacetylase [Xanthomonadaceae bacterium]|nr:PIG-L family deacetylase [Xanthomonadaceae bacterium]MDE2178432.1 PIG-L family deacetylase [Xanthomonadaceae bacterium]MDE2244847.1 PIG-L family deacetylase [Xanthomonadaceae bacterium]